MKVSPRPDLAFWLAIVGCCGLLVVAVTNVSLWTDEGFIAWVIDHRTPVDMMRALVPPMIISEADRQYPLYDLYMWAWTRAFGSSERVLRGANLPFAFLYVAALATASRSALGNRFAWMPFAIAPFVWYYVNEARPYMMLTALSASTVAALIIHAFGPPDAGRRARDCVLPLFLCAWATHILAALLVPGLVVLYVLARRGRSGGWLAWRGTVAIWSLPLLALAIYYASTIAGFGGRAEIQNNSGRGGSPAAFAVETLYEEAGFIGLGPSRSDLRAGFHLDVRSVLPIAAGALALAVASIVAFRAAERRRSVILIAGWAAAFGCAFLISEILHARFLGRHLAAVFPLLALAVIASLRSRVPAALVFAVFAASDVRLTALPYYGKDDYRTAVTAVIGRQAVDHAAIDWAADDYTANFYGLSLDGGRDLSDPTREPWPVRSRAAYVGGATPAGALALVTRQLRSGTPVILAMSRPDVFDPVRGWQTTIELLHPAVVGTYRNFVIYEFGRFDRFDPRTPNAKRGIKPAGLTYVERR